MALTRFGSKVSLLPFGCTSSLIVIHGYFTWNRFSASLNGCASRPLHMSQRTIVTGVLSILLEGVALELFELPPPHPAAARSASSAPMVSNRIRLICEASWKGFLYDGTAGQWFAGEQLIARGLERGGDGAVQHGVLPQLGGGQPRAER